MNVFSIGNLHFWIRDVKLEDEEDSNWSTQAVQGDTDVDGDDEEKKEAGESEKEPPCRYHPSLKGFYEFPKKRRKTKEDYDRIHVKNNRADFCDVCRLNLKFTNEFFASQYYKALLTVYLLLSVELVRCLIFYAQHLVRPIFSLTYNITDNLLYLPYTCCIVDCKQLSEVGAWFCTRHPSSY